MYSEQLNRTLAFGFILLAILFYCFVFKTYHGTGDDGDSISHYLYARWSWEMKYIWLNHWGKPVFTFFSSPFAQFGMKGIQFFNTGLGIITAFLSYKVADSLKLKYSAFIIPILLIMPEYMKTSFSGLTEILFAFLFVLSAFLFIQEKFFLSFLILSFLPFCRPDGTPLILLVGFFSLFHPALRKYIPILLTGHVILTVIGVTFLKEEWLWLFSKNSNTYHIANSSLGGWTSFVIGLLPFMTLPIYILFWLGILHFFIQFIKAEKKITLEFFLYFIAFTLFAMHTILYKFSLFRSIGLLRYLVPIAPILAILCLKGFSVSIDILDKLKIKRVVSCILLISILFIYAFSPAKYSLHYPQIFDLNPTQKLSINVYDFIKKEFPKSSLIYYSYPYFSILSGHNPYDWDLHRYIDKKRIREEIPKGSLIIWDNWYCVEDFGITPEKILAISSISEIKKFEIVHGKTKSSFIVFLKE
jgi:hypothetical protein